MHNPAVEYNVAAFSDLSFAVYAGREGKAEAITMSNSTNLMSSC